ncbi:MAG: UDP-N-acetylmuramoyl-L-alanyl-D-glutamate--2,6-diaminopimelate ligase [Psychrobacter sp.]|nr:UDP-N-acetylmuramoyl-L-alanyl-D-glutamate--2,6-diaminopimelate ligase [Psychrobacter sp.]
MIPAANSANNLTSNDVDSSQWATLAQVLAATLSQGQSQDLNLSNQSGSRWWAAYQDIMACPEVVALPFAQWRLDSRQIQSGDGFVLLKSQSQQSNEQAPIDRSRKFAQQAGDKAAFILSEIDPKLLNTNEAPLLLNCPIVYVPDIRHILGSLIQASLQLSYQVHQEPSQSATLSLPKVVAVTGTNGKTTISQLIAQLCQGAGMSSAIMGTAGNGRLGHLQQASHTTGDALAVQQFLQQMALEKVDILSLEASSHGLDQLRLQGVPVAVAIYSNLSRDHLDYHADMSEYADAKARLFDRYYFPDLTHAIINLDDKFAPIMIKRAEDSGLKVWTYSLNAHNEEKASQGTVKADFTARQIRPSLEGARVEIDSPMGQFWVDSPLLGRFNVANLLAAIAAAVALGVDVTRLANLVAELQGANGRMQRIQSDKGCFIVDYAHTPDALTQVLTSLKAHCSGQLWAVFGCGGDRDTGKRPLMAQAGLAQADRVILTSDNPRSENPLDILQDMQAGMTDEQHSRTHIEPDREQAIFYAVQHVAPEDIVVIAGKGHETYQEIKGVRHDFDDTVVVREALRQHAN